ncbi:MAG: flagellar motor switch protein FliM [Chloroflexi bacterium]|nr:flagellar motor switch protein FliM [Chloroflexota bacterium]
MEAKKILSQREIDSLLGSLGLEGTETQETGPTPQPEKDVRPYDFRRPDKFSKEHLRALQTIHESFARTTASSLSSYLRTSLQVRLSSIEQVAYGEYIPQLSNPTVVNIVSAEPLPGRMIIEVNLGLAFALSDRLMGGKGQIIQRGREITDIDLVLLQAVGKTLLSSLRETWLQMTPVNMKIEEMVFNPLLVQVALPGDIGILLLFELRMGDVSSTISMFIPYTLLEPIVGKLSAQIWLLSARRDRNVVAAGDDIRRQLDKVDVPVTVNLGTTAVSVRELLALRVGDVIRLGVDSDQEVEVLVGGKRKFWSRPGRMGRRVGVAVSRVVQEDNVAKISDVVDSAVGGE